MDVLSEARDQIERLRLTAEEREALRAIFSGLYKEVADEIERIRLTDEEQEAVRGAARMLKRDVADMCDGKVRSDAMKLVKSLRALLERLA